MNKTYRIVWSQANNDWVVTHEHATARGRQTTTRSLIRAGLLLAGLAAGAAGANPLNPQVVHGTAGFATSGNTLTVTNSANAIINWQGFSIDRNETTRFLQASPSSAVLNRVLGSDPSQLLGQLQSNGKVFLINPAGILVGPGARIDVAGLVAGTLNLANADFLAGRLDFTATPNAGNVVNQGGIATGAGGTVVLAGTQVTNDGIITTPQGQTILAAGQSVRISELGNPALRVEITGSANQATNLGQVMADAGQIGVVGALVKNSGTLRAGSAVAQGGRIFLKATQSVTLDQGTDGAGRLDAASAGQGGQVSIEGGFVAAGAPIRADGASGGRIDIRAGGTLSLAEPVSARGTAGTGGSVDYQAGMIVENSSGTTDVSGSTQGGTIHAAAGGTLMTSGTYSATGGSGQGGRIDLTARDLRLLSTQIDASGNTQGGLVRIGGAYQGGRNDEADGNRRQSFLTRWNAPTLANAGETFVNDGAEIDVSAKVGAGGTAIIWSDTRTTFLGHLDGRGATRGGAAEISSKAQLRYLDLQYIRLGQGGQLLLDPKNIVIGTAADASGWSYAGILRPASGSGSSVTIVLDKGGWLGSAVALNAAGDRLAVGAKDDGGFSNATSYSGAVHLFSFTDTSFGGGKLEGTLGKGYTGGKNVDLGLDANDAFGSAVALNAAGNRLAVGAPGTNSGSGAVHLFSFSDNDFSSGTQQSAIGRGYTGGKNVNMTGLEDNDSFGSAVALNAAGDRLAVGAKDDDGSGNPTGFANSGAVYLFSFTDTGFSGGALQSTLGKGYTGPTGTKNVDVSSLAENDYFGAAVALNAAGDRLAVGAPGDDGTTAGTDNYGAVHLFSFTDTSFSGGMLQSTIGSGYIGTAGTKNVNVTLGADDAFGSAVALNAAGDRLAVGAPYDDGTGTGANDYGAVYLFSFADTSFTGGTLQATLGKGYTGTKDVDVTLESEDQFGSAVALNNTGNRLAVGAQQDDGFNNVASNSGAVRLFTFDTDDSPANSFRSGQIARTIAAVSQRTEFGSAVALNDDGRLLAVGAPLDGGLDNGAAQSGAVRLYGFTDTSFGGGTLKGTLGKGYTGTGNVNINVLAAGDKFGAAVALNDDGTGLAVGAPYDDGNISGYDDSGAVYLFSFTDTSFGGGTLQATLGRGYTGGKNIDVSILADNDYFGSAVALNAAGDRLAVGAIGDNGSGGYFANAGAVHLFSFTGTSFSGGTLQATLGKDYTGGKSVSVTDLAANDLFGSAVALNAAGDRLAVGTPYDDGSGNTATNSGAVHLFSFTDTSFSGGTLQARIGKGYTTGASPKNVDVTGLEAEDKFGSAVALNNAGDRLAVGAKDDDGSGNTATNSGAVHLFSFTTDTSPATSFSGGTLQGTIGKGYTGTGNVSLTVLEASDAFGSAVAFNAAGDRLAAGAKGDGGADNFTPASGAVYLLTQSSGGGSVNRNFADMTGLTSNVSAAQLATSLSNGTDVTLQASNDITVDNAVTANNPSGNGGQLKLQAGRSILLNASITTDNGNFTAIANETVANGVVNADRESGAANISMAAGTTINAGTGTLTLALSSGAGLTHSTAGTVSLATINASRWLVYAPNPASVAKNGQTSNFRQYNTPYGGTINTATGNGFIYASAPGTLTVTPTLTSGSASHIYGDTPTAAFGQTLTGFADAEDNAANIGASGGSFSFTPTNATAAGGHTRSYVSGMTSSMGYGFTAGSGLAYTVTPRPLAVLSLATITKTYDGNTSVAVLPAPTFSNAIAGDIANLSLTGTGSYADRQVGTDKTVNYTGLALSGTAAGNYSLGASTASGLGNITRRLLTVSFAATTKTYDGNTSVAVMPAPTFSNALSGDLANLSVTATTGNYADPHAGTGKAVDYTGLSLSGAAAGNYSLGATTASGLGNITPRPLTLLSLAAATKPYDGNTSVAVLPAPTFSNAIAGDIANLSLTGTGSYADRQVGTDKTVNYTGLTLSGTAAGNYSLGTSTASGLGNISQLASVNWTGAVNNDWWNAANWAGGALPDNNNVAVAVIPGNASISSAVALNLGNTAITANGSSFSLDVTGGFTSGSGPLRTPAGSFSLFTRSPITIGSGGISAGTGIALSATTPDAGSTITLDGPLSTAAGSAVITAWGNIWQNANITAPVVGVTSTNGNIVIATNALTMASSINYSAVNGSISAGISNFSGGIPTLTAGELIYSTPASATPVAISNTLEQQQQDLSTALLTAGDIVTPADPPVLDTPITAGEGVTGNPLAPLLLFADPATDALTGMPNPTLLGGTIGGVTGQFGGAIPDLPTNPSNPDNANSNPNATPFQTHRPAPQRRLQSCSPS